VVLQGCACAFSQLIVCCWGFCEPQMDVLGGGGEVLLFLEEEAD